MKAIAVVLAIGLGLSSSAGPPRPRPTPFGFSSSETASRTSTTCPRCSKPWRSRAANPLFRGREFSSPARVSRTSGVPARLAARSPGRSGTSSSCSRGRRRRPRGARCCSDTPTGSPARSAPPAAGRRSTWSGRLRAGPRTSTTSASPTGWRPGRWTACCFPVGEAWRLAGKRDTKLGLYSDDLHPTPAGSYLAALVMYQQLYGASPVGLPAELSLEKGCGRRRSLGRGGEAPSGGGRGGEPKVREPVACARWVSP